MFKIVQNLGCLNTVVKHGHQAAEKRKNISSKNENLKKPLACYTE
jgi:hypothetical protein